MSSRRAVFACAMTALLPLLGIKTSSRADPPLSHLLGGLHTHTGYSDGVPGMRPADAYTRARDVERLDFFAVTEHSEAVDGPATLSEGCLPTEGGTIAECSLADDDPTEAAAKWDAQRRQATVESRPGTFTALRGFEWSSDVNGHSNVYFSRNYTQWLRDGGNATVEGFYRWLQTPAHLGGGDDGLAVFNHPGDKTVCDVTGADDFIPEACALDPKANWNDFAYVPELDQQIVAIEAFNRKRSYDGLITRALDKGWHLGVIGAEDIHGSNWGSTDYAKTVILASERTPAALKDAMAARRMYATLDSSIRIDFTGNGRPMGSRLRNPDSVSLSAHVTGGNVGRIDVLTNGGAIHATSAGRDLLASAPSSTDAWYMLRVVDSSGTIVAYSSPIWVERGPESQGFAARWVAGDLHIHTTWSHDSYGGPHDDETQIDEAYTLGWTPGEQLSIAESRGLQYLALTDHNNVNSAFDPGFTSGSMTLIPGYESSLAGHAQMLGTSRCVGPGGPASSVRCGGFSGADPVLVRAVADGIRERGGLFQINHPSDGNWLKTFGDGSAGNPIVPDTVEVWNIGPWQYQNPAPSSNDNDFSLRFWETYLNAGYRVAATGGSDNHWRSTTAVQGAGQPTTWVYVTKPGVAGIIEGIRLGRTTISHQPPALGGPQLFLFADDDGDGNPETMTGGTAGSDSTLMITANRRPPGSVYRVVSNTSMRVVEPSSEIVTRVPLTSDEIWARVELFVPDAQAQRTDVCDPLVGNIDVDGSGVTYCRNRLLMAALTSPIYFA